MALLLQQERWADLSQPDLGGGGDGAGPRELARILSVMRTVAGLVSLLAAAEEEPVPFSNERPRPAAPGAGSKLEKEALLSRPHWVLCSPTWTPGSLLPGTQLLFLPTSTPRSTLQPRKYAENSNLITPLLQWLPSYLAMGGRPVPALGPTTRSCVRPGHTGHEGLRRAMFSESVSAASGTFHPIPTPLTWSTGLR